MLMDKIASSQNDEYFTPPYAIEPIIKYIKPNKTVWCPFDLSDSYYVKMLKNNGNKVVNTHIFNGEDFFAIDVPECDYIISNPPYTLKGQVLKRLFQIDKPFAMLIGVVGLFESQERFNMFKNNNFEIMYLNKRVSYFQSYEEEKPSRNPPFSSVYVCHNMLPKQIVFEEIHK